MKNKLISIFVMMLMIATIFTLAPTASADGPDDFDITFGWVDEDNDGYIDVSYVGENQVYANKGMPYGDFDANTLVTALHFDDNGDGDDDQPFYLDTIKVVVWCADKTLHPNGWNDACMNHQLRIDGTVIGYPTNAIEHPYVGDNSNYPPNAKAYQITWSNVNFYVDHQLVIAFYYDIPESLRDTNYYFAAFNGENSDFFQNGPQDDYVSIYNLPSIDTRWNYNDRVDGQNVRQAVVTLGCLYNNNENNPPDTPSYQSPSDGETDVSCKPVELTWSCNDPNGDALTYDMYYDTNNPPTTYQGTTDGCSWSPNLDYSTKYYWKIIADDGEDATTGPIWSFTTEDSPPVEYTLTMQKEGHGSTSPSVGSHTYAEDAPVTISATHSSGWSFDHWSGDASGSTNPKTITMSEDKTITAHFVEDAPPEDVKWVVMCYLAGDNNLEGDLIDDIEEMEEVGSTNDVKVVVLYDGDGNGDSRLLDITNSNNLPGISSPDLEDNGFVIPSSNEVNMADPNTLIDFCSWVKRHEPYDDADRYCLILNDHGNSWKPDGSFVDDTSNDEMDIFELKDAISSISDRGSDKIDVLAFDACLMASIEVMYDMQNYVSFMVASEETEPATGFSYDLVLSDLVANPNMNSGQLSSVFVDRYNGPTLSAIKFDDKFDELINAIDDLIVAIFTLNDKEGSKEALNSTYLNVETYSLTGFCDMVDLYDLCVNAKLYFDNSNINNKCNNIMNLIEDHVVSNNHASANYGDSHGISIYLPGFVYEEEEDYFEYYKTLNFAQNTQWDELIEFYSGEESDNEIETAFNLPNADSSPSKQTNLQPTTNPDQTNPDANSMRSNLSIGGAAL